MELAVLDTGPVVAWLRADDPDHEASVSTLERSAGQGRLLATTWEVIGEAYTLIRRRFAGDAGPALQVLRWAEAVDLLPADPADHRRAHRILHGHRDLRLSYVDALLLAISERCRADEIITLDGELAAVRLGWPTQVTVL